MIPFYWQGSVIGAILGAIVIVVLGWLAYRSKFLDKQNIKKSHRFWLATAFLAIWGASFINVGHTQNSLQRQSFDSIGVAGPQGEVERVERKALSPEEISKRAQETRQSIHENAQ